jgi:hypothetical protein
LDVSGWRLPISGRYLCGHDERHWFVASLPFDRQTTTVRGAMEALKPAAVLRAQKRMGVKHRRYRRKTAAYVRQGEWFFLPRPMMHVGEKAVRNGELVRRGGKPHRVDWLYRSEDKDETFVRGAVSHPDHETLDLQVWHRVVQNNEVEPTPMAWPFTRMWYSVAKTFCTPTGRSLAWTASAVVAPITWLVRMPPPARKAAMT